VESKQEKPKVLIVITNLYFVSIRGNYYENSKNMLTPNDIAIEKEIVWDSGSGSNYFRDPVGNIVEFVTKGNW
jgi:hypothetical protein